MKKYKSLSEVKKDLLDTHREFILEHSSKSLHKIADLLSFKGLLVSESELRDWFRVIGEKREHDPVGKKKRPKRMVVRCFGTGVMPMGHRTSSAFKGNGGYMSGGHDADEFTLL